MSRPENKLPDDFPDNEAEMEKESRARIADTERSGRVRAAESSREEVTMMRPNNQAAPVNAPIASAFQFGQPCRRITEQRR